MRAAPPVDIPLSRDGGCAWCLGALAACAAAVPPLWLSWTLQAQRAAGPSVQMGLAVFVALAAIGALTAVRIALKRQPPLALRWTGAEWQLVERAAGQHVNVARPQICLDFGHALLLRGAGVPRGWPAWWTLSRATAPSAWHGLRVALHAAEGTALAAPQPGAGAP